MYSARIAAQQRAACEADRRRGREAHDHHTHTAEGRHVTKRISRRRLGLPPISCLSFRVSTGSARVDKLLQGGIQSGMVTEIIGHGRTGKTQLCITACCMGLLQHRKPLFMDAKGEFRPERLTSILSRLNLEHDVTMERFTHARVCSPEGFEELLEEASGRFAADPVAWGVLVVDDLMNTFIFDWDTDYKSRGRDLMERFGRAMTKLKAFAEAWNVAVIITDSRPQFGTAFGELKNTWCSSLPADARPGCTIHLHSTDPHSGNRHATLMRPSADDGPVPRSQRRAVFNIDNTGFCDPPSFSFEELPAALYPLIVTQLLQTDGGFRALPRLALTGSLGRRIVLDALTDGTLRVTTPLQPVWVVADPRLQDVERALAACMCLERSPATFVQAVQSVRRVVDGNTISLFRGRASLLSRMASQAGRKCGWDATHALRLLSEGESDCLSLFVSHPNREERRMGVAARSLVCEIGKLSSHLGVSGSALLQELLGRYAGYLSHTQVACLLISSYVQHFDAGGEAVSECLAADVTEMRHVNFMHGVAVFSHLARGDFDSERRYICVHRYLSAWTKAIDFPFAASPIEIDTLFSALRDVPLHERQKLLASVAMDWVVHLSTSMGTGQMSSSASARAMQDIATLGELFGTEAHA